MRQGEDVPEEGVAGANEPASDAKHRGNEYPTPSPPFTFGPCWGTGGEQNEGCDEVHPLQQ